MNNEKDSVINKIKQYFDSINSKFYVILKTPRVGQMVDNGYGLEFGLSEYALIHDIKDPEKELSLHKALNNIDFVDFNKEGCKNGIDALIKELNSTDGYEVIYKQI